MAQKSVAQSLNQNKTDQTKQNNVETWNSKKIKKAWKALP